MARGAAGALRRRRVHDETAETCALTFVLAAMTR